MLKASDLVFATALLSPHPTAQRASHCFQQTTVLQVASSLNGIGMHNPSRIAYRILTIHTAPVLVQPLHDCTPTALHATSQCSATEHRYQYNRSTIAHCHNKNTRSLRDCTCTKFEGACQYITYGSCFLQMNCLKSVGCRPRSQSCWLKGVPPVIL